MALELVQSIAPCYTYSRSGETINMVLHFFYVPQQDIYLSYILFRCDWPYWSMDRIAWNAVDGTINSTNTARELSYGLPFTSAAIGLGGYNHFYTTGNGFLDVREIDWISHSFTGWSCYDWTGRNPTVFRKAIVNRNDKVIAGSATWPLLYIYNYETHALMWQVALSNIPEYLCYESNEHLWAIYGNGLLAKINYRLGQHELLTKISTESDDIRYFCAFDTQRKLMTILRWKTDEGGVCRLRLEIYKPVPQAAIITAPVPVNSLKAGEKITFSGHVLGNAGEGITSRTVGAALTSPATGKLSAGRTLTGLNGSFELEYIAGLNNYVETLTVSTEV